MTEPNLEWKMGITTWEMTTAARDVRCLPDGSKISPALKHTLVTLATYWPHIWPGQERLAADMSINRRNLNRRLRKLEDAGLLTRIRRGPKTSTVYLLDIRTMRQCGAGATGIDNTPVEGVVPNKSDSSLDGYDL